MVMQTVHAGSAANQAWAEDTKTRMHKTIRTSQLHEGIGNVLCYNKVLWCYYFCPAKCCGILNK